MTEAKSAQRSNRTEPWREDYEVPVGEDRCPAHYGSVQCKFWRGHAPERHWALGGAVEWQDGHKPLGSTQPQLPPRPERLMPVRVIPHIDDEGGFQAGRVRYLHTAIKENEAIQAALDEFLKCSAEPPIKDVRGKE